ncbi:MAG: enolase C-terminal domain-like protein [Candidatus Bipolaricaulia bacterium]
MPEGVSFRAENLVSLGEVEAMAREAQDLVEAGFKVLKLKLGTDPRVDVDRVRAVRHAVGERIRLRLDANQGWTRQQAIAVLNRAADYDVELVEQPVAAVQFAAATRNVRFRDLDMGTELEESLIRRGGSELADGHRIVPQPPGLGIEAVNEALLGEPAVVYRS